MVKRVPTTLKMLKLRRKKNWIGIDVEQVSGIGQVLGCRLRALGIRTALSLKARTKRLTKDKFVTWMRNKINANIRQSLMAYKILRSRGTKWCKAKKKQAQKKKRRQKLQKKRNRKYNKKMVRKIRKIKAKLFKKKSKSRLKLKSSRCLSKSLSISNSSINSYDKHKSKRVIRHMKKKEHRKQGHGDRYHNNEIRKKTPSKKINVHVDYLEESGYRSEPTINTSPSSKDYRTFMEDHRSCNGKRSRLSKDTVHSTRIRVKTKRKKSHKRPPRRLASSYYMLLV